MTSADIFRWVGGLFWPFIRLSAMFMAAPIFGARTLPIRVRIILALFVAVMLYGTLPAVPAVDPLSPAGFLITLHEVLIGVAMGFIMQLVFGAVVIAGQNVAMSMGLGFASAVDPQNGVQVPVMSQYYMVITTLLFLALDGHLVLIDTLANSFRLLPIGSGAFTPQFAWEIATWGSFMFAGGVLVAIPVMTAMLLVNLSFGVITRVAPQLNIFAVGFPITLLAGFVLVLFSTPSLLPQISTLFGDAFMTLQDLMGGQP